MFLLLGGNVEYPIASLLSFAVTIILAFAYHEFAHAIVADRLGDPTPRQYGRITLNPVAHLDRAGLLLALLFGFGWASTPVNPFQLRGNRRSSHAIVAVAGPIANLIMALLFAAPIFLGLVSPQPPLETWLPSAYSFLALAAWFNVILFLLNLVPIPPLDGFTILLGVLPADWAYQLEPLRRYGLLLLLGVFFLLPYLGIDILGLLVFRPAFQLFSLLTGGTPFLFI